jgi:hypothetical protein
MIRTWRENQLAFFIAIAVLLSRIPFLFTGYGSEEDAWGLILVARNISLSGVYEVSRLPGHPLQELLLSLAWKLPSWLLNFFTAVISSAAVLFLMLSLKKINCRNYLLAGLFLAFAPAFYMNSSNIMDYNWTIALVIFSFYNVLRGNIINAAIFLGLACGFRITAGAMLLPLAFILMREEQSLQKIILFSTVTIATALICFIPVWYTYGSDFFTYYEYFPYPPLAKNIYKATIGAWGLPGFLALIAGVVMAGYNLIDLRKKENRLRTTLIVSCLITIFLYTYAFIKIPQKSAFVIPVIPFIAVIFALLLNYRQMALVISLMIFSSFFLGVNLDDTIRGSGKSSIAIPVVINKTAVLFDVLRGPVIADHMKRKIKSGYASSLAEKLSHSKDKIIIIAGWWQNELKYFALSHPNPQVKYLYYADENELLSETSGAKIYYLPEQDYYNDLRFKRTFTSAIAEPLN